jgi:hypothetical protein
VVSEVNRISLARAARIVSRLQEILAQDFPTSTPEVFARLVQRIVEGIAALLRGSSLDERSEKFACSLLAELGSHLRYVESATSSRVPASFIEPIEALIAKVTPSSRVMLRVQWTFNYKVFDIAEYYRKMIDPLVGIGSIDSYLEGLEHFYIVSVPSIENVNALLHCIVGHEFGHRVARSYLDQEDQEQLIRSIWERVGDLKWLPSVDSLPPIFQLPIRQEVFEFILQARRRALEEIISDFVGYFLFGPGAVFALAEVAATDIWDALPSAQNDYYPPWRFRLREIVRVASADDLQASVIALDGGDPIASIRVATVKYLQQLDKVASVTTDLQAIDADERLKRAYQDIPELLKGIPGFISKHLDPVRYPLSEFSTSMSPLLSRLALGLPPDDVGSGNPDFRLAMNAGWLYRLARLPIPHDVGRSWEPTDDDVLNRLVLKGVESIQLSSEFRKWMETNAGET